MDYEALPESIELADCLLNSEQKQIIERATKEIYDKPDTYELDFFWRFDSSIGGIGGCCMPFNPTINPFPGGIGRFLFRPLQYAAANIECNKGIYDNYDAARSTVQNSGLYLESVTKYVIRRRTFPVIPVWSWRSTLGRNIRYLTKMGAISDNKVGPSGFFVELCNKSKHDTNPGNERERQFCPTDALIAYISARILGEALLKPYYPDLLKTLETHLGRLYNPNWNIQSNSVKR